MFTYWDLDLTSTAIVRDARLVFCTVISHAIYARAGIKIIWTWRIAVRLCNAMRLSMAALELMAEYWVP